VSEKRRPPDLAKRRRNLRTLVSVVFALALQAIVWAAIVHYFITRRVWYGFFDVSDIGLYRDYAGQFARGLHPYSNVPFEYPPLAAPLMVLARWIGDWTGWDYDTAFATEMVGLCAAAACFATAVAARLAAGFGRPIATAVAFALITLFAGPIIANRFDIAVALDIAVFAYCMARRWWWVAGAILGVGFALKLTPAMFLPLVLVFAPRLRQFAWSALAFLVAAALAFLPHLLRSKAALLYVFKYHGERPLQIESLYSTPYLLGHVLAGHSVVIGNSHGSQSLIAPGAETLAACSMWIMAACVSAFYLLLWRRRWYLRQSPSDVSFAALGLVLVFLCTSKVLSPQFMIWMLPLVALVTASPRVSRRRVGYLLLAAVLLTQVGFPSRYWDLVALQPVPVILVSVRNLILMICAVLVTLLLSKRAPYISGSSRRSC
jgi:hypothetical protein